MKVLDDLQDYLQSESKQTYRALCEEWRAVRQLLAEAEKKEAELKQQIISAANGKEIMEWGVKVANITVTGSVDYKAIPEVQQLDKNYLDGFRRPTRVDIKVTPY